MLHKLALAFIHYLLAMIYDTISTTFAHLTALPTDNPAAAAAAASRMRFLREASTAPSRARADTTTNDIKWFIIGGPGRGIPKMLVGRLEGSRTQANARAIEVSEEWEPNEVYVHKGLLTAEIQLDHFCGGAKRQGVAWHTWLFIDADAVDMMHTPSSKCVFGDLVKCVATWAVTKTCDGSVPYLVRDKYLTLAEVEIANFQVNPAKRKKGYGRAAVEAIHGYDAGQTRSTLECKVAVSDFYRSCGFETAQEDMGQIPSQPGYVWLTRAF